MDPTCPCFTDSSAKCSAPRSNIACHGILEEHLKNMWHYVTSCDIMWHRFGTDSSAKMGVCQGPVTSYKFCSLALDELGALGASQNKEHQHESHEGHETTSSTSDGTIWRHEKSSDFITVASLLSSLHVSCDSIKHIKPHCLRGRGEAVMLCHRKRQPGELSDVVSASQKVKRKRQPEMATVLLPLLTKTLPGTCAKAVPCILRHSSLGPRWKTHERLSWRPSPGRTGAPDICSSNIFKHQTRYPTKLSDVQRNGGKMWKVTSEYTSQVLVPLGSSWHTTSQEWPCDNCFKKKQVVNRHHEKSSCASAARKSWWSTWKLDRLWTLWTPQKGGQQPPILR